MSRFLNGPATESKNSIHGDKMTGMYSSPNSAHFSVVQTVSSSATCNAYMYRLSSLECHNDEEMNQKKATEKYGSRLKYNPKWLQWILFKPDHDSNVATSH